MTFVCGRCGSRDFTNVGELRVDQVGLELVTQAESDLSKNDDIQLGLKSIFFLEHLMLCILEVMSPCRRPSQSKASHLFQDRVIEKQNCKARCHNCRSRCFDLRRIRMSSKVDKNAVVLNEIEKGGHTRRRRGNSSSKSRSTSL